MQKKSFFQVLFQTWMMSAAAFKSSSNEAVGWFSRSLSGQRSQFLQGRNKLLDKGGPGNSRAAWAATVRREAAIRRLRQRERERERERKRERVKRVIMVVKRAERKVSSQGVSFLFRPRLPQHRPSLTLGSPVGRLHCGTSSMQLTRLVNQLLDKTLLASKRTSLVVEKLKSQYP